MNIPPYKDLDPSWEPSAGGYAAPNECLTLHEQALADRTFSRAAAICSGGEVPLFNFLPRSYEVLAIDHSHRSMAFAMLKVLILGNKGPEKFREACLDDNLTRPYGAPLKLQLLAEEFYPQLPESLRAAVTIDGKFAGFDCACEGGHVIRTRCNELSLAQIAAAYERLDRLSFVHGDLRDLKEMGQFDGVYVSNAFGHLASKRFAEVVPEAVPQGSYQRSGKPPRLRDFNEVVAAGGHLLTTGGTGEWSSDPTIPLIDTPAGKVPKGWKHVARINSFPRPVASPSDSWTRDLLQREI